MWRGNQGKDSALLPIHFYSIWKGPHFIGIWHLKTVPFNSECKCTYRLCPQKWRNFPTFENSCIWRSVYKYGWYCWWWWHWIWHWLWLVYLTYISPLGFIDPRGWASQRFSWIWNCSGGEYWASTSGYGFFSGSQVPLHHVGETGELHDLLISFNSRQYFSVKKALKLLGSHWK